MLHPIKMSIYKSGHFEEVNNFPFTDAEFYSAMINLPKNQSILVEIERDSKFRWTDLLIGKLTGYKDTEVKISDKISLLSQPEIGTEYTFRHIITSISGDEKLYWIISFYDREVNRYVIEWLDPSTAELMFKDIADKKRMRELRR